MSVILFPIKGSIDHILTVTGGKPLQQKTIIFKPKISRKILSRHRKNLNITNTLAIFKFCCSDIANQFRF
ncbi:MAG: hypothetical protein WCJ49_05015 [Deltaproteobacteria bacterium]